MSILTFLCLITYWLAVQLEVVHYSDSLKRQNHEVLPTTDIGDAYRDQEIYSFQRGFSLQDPPILIHEENLGRIRWEL
jgi:hypothetical protein